MYAVFVGVSAWEQNLAYDYVKDSKQLEIQRIHYYSMAEKHKFTIVIQEEPEGGYTGKCLELRGAVSYGKTLDELRENMKEAISLVLETLREEAQSKRKEIIEIS